MTKSLSNFTKQFHEMERQTSLIKSFRILEELAQHGSMANEELAAFYLEVPATGTQTALRLARAVALGALGRCCRIVCCSPWPAPSAAVQQSLLNIPFKNEESQLSIQDILI